MVTVMLGMCYGRCTLKSWLNHLPS